MDKNNFDFKSEIERHRLGLRQFECGKHPLTTRSCDLSQQLVDVLRASNASYWEIQEALVLADGHLFDEFISPQKH